MILMLGGFREGAAFLMDRVVSKRMEMRIVEISRIMGLSDMMG